MQEEERYMYNVNVNVLERTLSVKPQLSKDLQVGAAMHVVRISAYSAACLFSRSAVHGLLLQRTDERTDSVND